MKSTLKLIYLTSLFYDHIYITKPLTSRPANSEKYIVCKGFKGFNEKVFNNLLHNLTLWHNQHENEILYDIEGLSLPNSFLDLLYNFNSYLLKKQIKSILRTLVYIKLNIECEELSLIRKSQIRYAIQWCSKYGINLNYRSKYVNGSY